MRATIAENLARVHQRIDDASARSGRSSADVSLVAVTKYVDAEVARALLECGCHDLGESRPQELWTKADALTDTDVRWHMIGHLQRNKARRTASVVSLLHSGDSIRLLEELDRCASDRERPLPVLLEVNISGDASKHGFAREEVESALITASQLNHLEVRGLMAMASLAGDSDDARRDFASLRELRDDLRGIAPSNVMLDELSMGMSRDFEVAIEEGATLVRVGSALFEGLS